jgi:PhzF family phenazine biosynthesis protein
VTALRTKAGRKTIVKSDDGVSIDLAHNVHIHDTPFAGKPYAHYPVVSIVKGMTFILAKFQNLEELAAQYDNLLGMRNCYTSYSALDQDWREGIVTSFYYVDIGVDERSGRRRLRTRSFGAREDPGTGSASAALSSYLTLTESGPRVRRYHLTQGVEIGRQCDIFVDVALSEAGSTIESVILYGNAVKVMEGVIDVPFGGH